jgi:Spy/CpxP family protein refolding chaperone
MKTRNMMLTLGLAMALPLTAVAGDEKGKDVAKALGLDSTRAEQVEEIIDDYHEQHKEIKERKEERLDAVLTDDEMDRLKAMHKAKKKDYKDR